MRIFKTKWFSRWARKQQLDDTALVAAINAISEGLIDAGLGGHLYKMRVGRPGQGKAFFVYGFAKSARGNIEASELKALQRLASELLDYEENQLRLAFAAGELQEVN